MQRLAITTEQLSGAKSVDLLAHVPMAPPDPILGTAIAFKNDKDKNKINLGIGAYRDDKGEPYVFNVVKKAENKILSGKYNKEYLPIDGSTEFCDGCRRLLFGANNEVVKSGRVATLQAISGTGALSLGFAFLGDFLPRWIYISKPTWLNHNNIIDFAKLKWVEYPYYNAKTNTFDCEAMLKFLSNAVSGSIVLLHACAHNPTGVDPTEEQWKQIADVMKKNSLIPYFDSAYQGFGSGDLEKDAWPIRYFLEQGFQMIVAQSFAKNMGLYGERIGALHFVTENKDTAAKVLSQAKIIARKLYSNPPLHGALLAEMILNDKALFEEWKVELRDVVAARIIEMRKALRAELERIETPGKWNHITDQIGMFSYTGLTPAQCEVLINKYHVYLLKSGRISMAGINRNNLAYLASSIKNAIKQGK